MNRPQMTTEEKDRFITPDAIVQDLNKGLKKTFGVGITLDVAAEALSAKAARFFTREQDGLAQSWHTPGFWWCNPPYSNQAKIFFLEKALEELQKGHEGFMLLPSSQEVGWFRTLVSSKGFRQLFLPGRISFLHPDTRIPVHGNRGGNVLVAFTWRTPLPTVLGEEWWGPCK